MRKRVIIVILAMIFILLYTNASARPAIDNAWTLIADLLSHYGEDGLMLGEGTQSPVSDEEFEDYSKIYDMNENNVIAIFNVFDNKIILLGKKDDDKWHSIEWSGLSETVIVGNSIRVANNYKAIESYSKGAVLLHVHKEMEELLINSIAEAEQFLNDNATSSR